MKKVILIGEFNDITKQINDSLSSYCRVQLCASNVEIVEGMLKLFVPDLAIVSLTGALTTQEDILSLLYREIPDVPLIATGSQEDEDNLTDDGFLPDERIRFIRQPAKPEDVVLRAKEILIIGETHESHESPGASGSAGSAESSESAADGLKKILIVDDNPTMLRTVQFMLSEKYKVTFATSGTKAIAAIAKSRPDLILLDYDMPVCDGKMTLQMLRSEDDTKDIPVIFLTGCSDADHVKEVLALRPQGYLLKPPTLGRLCDTIEQALENTENTK